jgi:hypothetical protein
VRLQETYDEWPELRALEPWSAAFWAEYRRLMLAKYPGVDQCSRDNLDMFVRLAEAKEQAP